MPEIIRKLIQVLLFIVLLLIGLTPHVRANIPNVGCSTIELIDAINAASSGDTLSLTWGCTYTLSNAYSSEAGLPTISKMLTIIGNDATIVRNSGSAFRIFNIGVSGNLTVSRLIVRNGLVTGSDTGAGFYNAGSLTVNESCIVGNIASQGGGIFNASATAVDAKSNWWGSTDGPSGYAYGSGDAISANVDVLDFKAIAPIGCDLLFIPANDLFAMPTEITSLPFSATRVVDGSTVNFNEPNMSCAPNHTNTVWYHYTPSANQTLLLDAAGYWHDAALAVYSADYVGSHTGFTEIGCNDNAASGQQAQLQVNLVAGTSYFIMVANVGTQPLTQMSILSLTGLAPLPGDTTITNIGTGGGGIPIIYWQHDLSLTTHGCSGGTASYEVLQGATVFRSGSMTEGPAGTYTTIIPQLYPVHGYARVVITIGCPGASTTTIDFDIYIDPSGHVRTVDGDPIPGATVTLYRSDSSSGPFDAVPNGSGIMSLANRNNPSTTDSEGRFGWDVIAGYYRVRAEREGCVSSTNSAQPFEESPVLTIPPAVTDLDLRLACSIGLIDGTIQLQGRPATPNASWVVALHVVMTPQGGGAPIYDGEVTTDENGQFQLDWLMPGDYRLWVKGSHTLAVAQDVTVVVGANVVTVDVLREGDTDGNNVVNLTDFSLLAGSFGKQSGNPGYDGRADFNGDTVVNLTDFSLLATSFGQSGAP